MHVSARSWFRDDVVDDQDDRPSARNNKRLEDDDDQEGREAGGLAWLSRLVDLAKRKDQVKVVTRNLFDEPTFSFPSLSLSLLYFAPFPTIEAGASSSFVWLG